MHWGRLAVTGFFSLMVVQHFFGWWTQDPAQAGRSAFSSSMALGFVLAMSACLITADTLSGERREGTLGLLLLTPLSVLSVVLGKLASAGLTVFCALLGLIPALMLPVLAGGVTAGESVRSGFALLATASLGLAAGLWASSAEAERTRVVRRSVRLMILLVLAPLPLGLGWEMAGLASFFPGPLDALRAAGASEYAASPSRFYWGLLVQAAVAGILLWTARSRVKARAVDELPEPPVRRGDTQEAPVGDQNPLAWRIHRLVAVRRTVWAATGLLAAGGMGTLVSFYSGTGGVMSAGLLYFFGQWGGTALAAWGGSRFFLEVRRSGELELLRTTPTGAGGLIHVHRQVFRAALRGPMFMLVAVGGVKLLFALKVTMWGMVPILYLVVLPLAVDLARLYAAIGLGTLLGLRVRRPATAVLLTMVAVEGGPLVLMLLMQVGIALLTPQAGGSVSTGVQVASTVVYFLAHPVFVAAVGHWARRRLEQLARADGWAADESWTRTIKGFWALVLRVRHWTPG